MAGESESTARVWSNKRGARKCPSKGTNVHHILPFERFLRAIWPHDRAKNYMRITGAKPSTAKHRISGRRDPDYAEIVALLRSEQGYAFLEYAMGDAGPAWWRGIRKTRSLAKMRRELDEQRRRIEQLELSID